MAAHSTSFQRFNITVLKLRPHLFREDLELSRLLSSNPEKTTCCKCTLFAADLAVPGIEDSIRVLCVFLCGLAPLREKLTRNASNDSPLSFADSVQPHAVCVAIRAVGGAIGLEDAGD